MNNERTTKPSGIPGHRQHLDLEHLLVIPVGLTHHLGQLVQQRLEILPARQRHGPAQLAGNGRRGQDDELGVGPAVAQQPQDRRADRVRRGLHLRRELPLLRLLARHRPSFVGRAPCGSHGAGPHGCRGVIRPPT